MIVPVPVEPSGPPEHKDIAALTYGANPEKKGLDRVLAAWRRDRSPGEELLVAGLAGDDEPGVSYLGMVPRDAYRALLRRARVFVTAPRREDYGIAQLEALLEQREAFDADVIETMQTNLASWRESNGS